MSESVVSEAPVRRPRVSIIIPCWNGERYVAEAISSALGQTYDNIEIVFVDDGSTDRSLEIARSFPQIKILTQQNEGVSAARNAGLEASDGEFVMFFDADDRLLPDAVRDHLDAFSHQPTAPLVYGAMRIIDSLGNVVEQNPEAVGYMGWPEILRRITPTPSQSMFRRDAVMAAGRFTPALRLVEDFDLYLRLARRSDLYCHARLVTDYRRHSQQETTYLADNLVLILDAVDRALLSAEDPSETDAVRKDAHAHWIAFYGQYIPFEVVRSLRTRAWARAARAVGTYLRYLPGTAMASFQYLRTRLGQAVN